MECQPAAGHFALLLDGQPVLVSPAVGYSLRSCLRSCMLVDGKGQIGDVGYPMSIPSQPHRGERVESVRWEESAGEGAIRLDLKRAYPTESGVTHYTREFLILPGKRIVCRDHVVLSRAGVLSWLFQSVRDAGLAVEDGSARIGRAPCLQITPRVAGPYRLTASVAPTPVVYSYSGDRRPVEHARFDTPEPVLTATVDFVLSW
jgi:hypothetical protein